MARRVGLVHGGEDFVDRVAEEVAVGCLFFTDAEIDMRVGILGDRVEIGDGIGVALRLEVLLGDIHRNDVVRLGKTFDTGDSRRHGPVVDDGHGSGCAHGAGHPGVEIVEILAVALVHGQTVSGEGLGHRETLDVVAGVTGDGDIVVIDDEFDLESVGDSDAGGLGVVALLLRAVGAETEDRRAGVRHGDAVDVRPHVAEPARAESHPGSVAEFGVAGQVSAGLTVVEDRFGGQVPVEHRHEVLDRHPVPGFVEIGGVGLPGPNEAIGDEHLGDDVVGAAGVAADASGRSGRREEDDGVTAELNVGRELAPLFGGQGFDLRVEGQRTELTEVHGEGFVGGQCGAPPRC